jgi:hypothetical protein
LETDSVLHSAWQAVEKIFHTRNERLCLGFMDWRTVVPLMIRWILVTFRTLRPIHATNSLVSSGTDVSASTPFGAQTGTSNSNVAKFICVQISRLWMSPAELDFRFGSYARSRSRAETIQVAIVKLCLPSGR